jgi:mono/diheme cytochrome c family protein
MPSFGNGLESGEVADLVAFLQSLAPRGRRVSDEVRMALNVADPARGQLLFRSLGCLGCHTRGGPLASASERVGPDLTDLARKRTRAAIASLLEKPRNRPTGRHRPDLRLSADEAAHIAAYLTDAKLAQAEPANTPQLPRGDAERGKGLAERLRCAACHALGGLKPTRPAIPLAAGVNPEGGCLAPAPAAGIPRFALSESQRNALCAFVAGLPMDPSVAAPSTVAEDTIRRLGCFGCHARGGQGGTFLGAQIADALGSDPALGGLKVTLTPPDLSAVGDKLRPEFLALAVRGQAPAARPWLSVRMPAFVFGQGEAESIARYFERHDRFEARAAEITSAAPLHPDNRAFDAAARLIGQRGFGCVNCHVLAGKVPPGGEAETLGPDLALAHRRMTNTYFRRWIANPQRILPGTPMPQFLQPVATLPGTLDEELDAIWNALTSERATELATAGTRALLAQQGERASVVRDMVVFPESPASPYTPRGLAIGLKGGHSVLFDTDRIAWLAWWHGDFLTRTKSGRLWEWHPAGPLIWTAPERGSPILFIDAQGVVLPPGELRERFGSFDAVEFTRRGVKLNYTLHGPASQAVRVIEEIEPIESGWERRIAVENVPDGYRPALVERAPTGTERAHGGTALVWKAGERMVRLEVVEPRGADMRSTANGTGAFVVPMRPSVQGAFTARVAITLR